MASTVLGAGGDRELTKAAEKQLLGGEEQVAILLEAPGTSIILGCC